MRSARVFQLLFAAGFLVAVAFLYGYLRRDSGDLHQKVYRIGWQNDPPFQESAADGSPAGLAIDVVRTAARLRGIRLQWISYPRGADAGLRSHDVDLWPLLTILPERKG